MLHYNLFKCVTDTYNLGLDVASSTDTVLVLPGPELRFADFTRTQTVDSTEKCYTGWIR